MTTDEKITVRGLKGRYVSIPYDAVDAAITEDDYDDMMRVSYYMTPDGVEDDSTERKYEVMQRRAAEMLRDPESPYYDPDIDSDQDEDDIAF